MTTVSSLLELLLLHVCMRRRTLSASTYVSAVGYVPEMDTLASLICHDCIANKAAISHYLQIELILMRAVAAYVCDRA